MVEGDLFELAVKVYDTDGVPLRGQRVFALVAMAGDMLLPRLHKPDFGNSVKRDREWLRSTSVN